jgi:hypothetical protein
MRKVRPAPGERNTPISSSSGLSTIGNQACGAQVAEFLKRGFFDEAHARLP